MCTLGSRVSQGNVPRHLVPEGTGYRERVFEKQSRVFRISFLNLSVLFPSELTSKTVSLLHRSDFAFKWVIGRCFPMGSRLTVISAFLPAEVTSHCGLVITLEELEIQLHGSYCSAVTPSIQSKVFI